MQEDHRPCASAEDEEEDWSLLELQRAQRHVRHEQAVRDIDAHM